MEMKLDLLYQNVRGLRTKAQLSLQNMALLDREIVCLTETWLTTSLPSSLFFPSNYMVERNDRQCTNALRGGGVCIALKNTIPYVRRYDLEEHVECVWVELQLHPRNLLLGVHYIPGHRSAAQLDAYVNFLCDVLEPHSSFLILGDFNCPEFNSPALNSPRKESLHCFSAYFSLNQLNSVVNSRGGVLDLVFTNIPGVVDRCVESLVPEDGYHPTLDVSLSISSTMKVTKMLIPLLFANTLKGTTFLYIFISLTMIGGLSLPLRMLNWLLLASLL